MSCVPRLLRALRLGALMSVTVTSLNLLAQDAQTAQPAQMQAAQSQPAQQPADGPKPAESPGSQRFVLKDYSKPWGHFPNPLAPYTTREVPPPNLSNTPRITELMKNGKLMLSINDAVALALENNLDIAIARYNLNIADTDILRSKAGSSILGVNSGILQGTPGGNVGTIGTAVGSGSGGTTSGSGGAATGSSGIVESTVGLGSLIQSYDPIITGTLQIDRNNSICSSSFCLPNIVKQNTSTADFTYSQFFPSGTTLGLAFNNSRTTTNSAFTKVSPDLASNFQFRLTQHLLQGFGTAANKRLIRIAKNNREITDVAFRLQLITTVDQIENIYWNLVYAYDLVRVQEEALTYAQRSLDDTKKQVQIGTLAPIEIVRAQSTVSTDQQALIASQTNLELQELLMKNALSRTIVDPSLAQARVIPTSVMELPANEPVTPVQDLINSALTHRPDLAESRIDLVNREISNKAVRNAVRPTVDLFAYYGGSGLGGRQNPANLCGAVPTGFCINPNDPSTGTPFPTSGYGSTLNQLIDSTAPDKGVGMTLNIPLRNRSAEATQIRAELEYRQAQMRLQQLENQVRIEVINAQYNLQQNRASVEAAQAATNFARESLDAEQKKLNFGASTSTNVLQFSSGLRTSEANLVSARAAYEKSRVELDRATGLLLENAGIIVAEGERGEVTKMPTVPMVAPRQDIPQQLASPPPENAPQQTPPPSAPPQ